MSASATDAVSPALVEALARLAGLTIDPSHQPGVRLNLERLLAQGAVVMAVPLPAGAEPAAFFAP